MCRPALLTIATFAAVNLAQAGTVYTMSEKIGPNPGNTRLSVEGESLRMDQSGEDTVIFSGSKGHAVTIDHKKQSYMVIDRSAMAQLNPALEQMRKRLESLPPEQRAMAEKMMRGNRPANEPAEQRWTITPSGQTDSQAGIDCEWYDVSLDGKLSQRLCMAEPDDVIGGRAALANMRAMALFFDEVFAEIRKNFPVPMPDNPMANIDKIDGFPIITQELSNGTLRSDLRLESAEEATLGSGTFDPPATYSQQKFGSR